MGKGTHLGEFEQKVLEAVRLLGANAYGVPIRREIEVRTGRRVAAGAIYATLDRLEAKGYVASFRGGATSARGGRSKRYFVLTAPGATALEACWRMNDRMRSA